MSAAEELRAAAKRIREVAGNATPGPWAWEATGLQDNSWGLGVVVDSDDESLSGDITDVEDTEIVDAVCTGDDNIPNAEHIALWSPITALAVADWLDDEARWPDAEITENYVTSTSGRMAIAVARAVNGGEPS